MRRRLTLLLPLLVLTALFLTWFKPNEKSGIPSFNGTVAEPPKSRVFEDFKEWFQDQRLRKVPTADFARGIELATARKQLMAEWIVSQPAQALENAVSWSEYQALPAELRPYFEKPFNTVGNLRVLPVCDPTANSDVLRVLEIDGESWTASVFGQRLGHSTKESAPLAGITLDDRAAVSDTVFEILTPEDAEALAQVPLGNRDASRDFSTARPLGDHPITALAGGRRFLFENTEVIDFANEKLARFDETPGPHGGSRQVFALADAGDGSDAINWVQVEELVQMEADAWTENPKSVFFIRVDFSDAPGEAVSQATLDQVLNNAVADSISEMSYGKTTINATVSPTTVRMPLPKTSYLPSNNDGLYNAARAAYLAIAGASALNNYDIVGVHFPSIGISSDGVTYAGLAGGSRQWLQGTSSSNVIIHEFGHNYGIGHASFWQTSDGSVVGTGGSVEYGDPFDIMGSGPDPEGHFHMQAKQKLNWLDSTKWTDATASGSGTYRIYRFDHPATTGSRRGVRITKGTSPVQYYWLGYRPGIPNNPTLEKGAYLVWQYPGQTRSWLLDTTPGSSGGRDDSAITLGKTYSDTVANVHITPLAIGGAGADAWLDVNVQIGAFAGNSAPTATLNVPAGATARTPLAFSVNASDPNGDTLAYSWDFGDSSVSNNSSSVSHSWAVGGTYAVSVTVSDMKGRRVTVSQSVTVSDPLNTWTQRTSGTIADLADIAVGGGKLVAVGNDRGTYRVSTNGTTWTGDDIWVSGSTALNLYLEGIVYDGTKFVAAGYDYNSTPPNPTGWIGVIYTSPDGTNWTRRHFSGSKLHDIAYGGGIYVAVGEAGTMWRSTDGIAWSPVPSGETVRLYGVAYGSNRFVAVGWGGTGTPVVLTSSNGTSWTNTTPGSGIGAVVIGEVAEEIEYCHDRFLVSSQNINIRYSTNGGITFQDSRSVPEGRAAFTHGNGVFLSAGVDSANGETNINLLSTNGSNWTPIATPSLANRNATTFFNNTFITVGDSGEIWQSNPFTAPVAPPTGYAAWFALHFPESPPLSGVADDFDGDGIPNLGEYATATDPRDGGDRVELSSVTTGGYFTLTVSKDPTVTDVAVSMQASSDLQNWSTTGTTVVADDPATLSVQINTPISNPSPGRQFLRVMFHQIN